jgi:hypothetical protein
VLGDPVQWIALGVGSYAIFSWAASLGRRTRPLSPRSGNRLHAGRDHRYGLISFCPTPIRRWPICDPHLPRRTDEVAIMVGGLAAAAARQGDRRRRDGGPPEPGHDNARRVLVVIGGLAAGCCPMP